MVAKGPLGCATAYRVELTARGGKRVLGTFDGDGTALVWGRDLDAISSAQIDVVKKRTSSECCALAADAEPYMHELTIYRDDVIVWSGPVTGEPTETRTTISIPARDVLEWLTVRSNQEEWRGDFAVVDYITDLVTFALNLDDPNILQYVAFPVSATWEIERDIPDRDRSVWDAIAEVLDSGINATTIGRRIRLTNANADAARAADAVLTDADFAASLAVKRDGNNMATKVTVIGNGGRKVTVGGSRPGFGIVERIIRNEQYKKTASLQRLGNAYRARNYPAKTILVVPSNATLTQTAPVGINDLVCGRNLTVSLDPEVWCRPMRQKFRLAAVRVKWIAGEETVGVSLDAPWIEGETDG